MERCSVCGSEKKLLKDSRQIGNKNYYFCSQHCVRNFDEQPGRYLTAMGDIDNKRIAHRKIHFAEPLNMEIVDLLRSVLRGLPGVERVVINISGIVVTYDLSQIEEIQMFDALSEVELAIKNNWFERLQKRLVEKNIENSSNE